MEIVRAMSTCYTLLTAGRIQLGITMPKWKAAAELHARLSGIILLENLIATSLLDKQSYNY
jgi:hypothetical protein